MQISKLSIIALLAATGGLQLLAQPASPELQNKALELLRQTISQERQQPSQMTHPQTAPTPTAQTQVMPAATAQPQVAPAATAPTQIAPASSDQQEKAVRLLRQTLEEQRRGSYSGSPQPAAQTQPPTSTNAGTISPGQGATGAANVGATPLAAPESPISPTKQQQLMKLLDEYKADKLTPAEYQAQRAKILSAP